MKRMLSIGTVLFVFLSACTHRPVETQNFASPHIDASPALSAIDSLMWQQPDSALACLLPYFDTCRRDGVHTVSTLYNSHYAHLLLAELLYKNDYAQTNRAELQQAVAYFDSLVRQTPPLQRRLRGFKKPSFNPNDILAFLDARAHYINGAGYYEKDSVIEACKEYLRALEVMEEHFEEKELVGHKARFMAYTYNRLMELFSIQFMMEPAITCGENILTYYQREPFLSKYIPNILYHIGKQYDKKGDKSKARSYYEQALERMSDTKSLVYRDIVCLKVLCDYQIGEGMEQSLAMLKQILTEVQDEKERLARFLTIGGIFIEEGIYDSALLYLTPVYDHAENRFLQIQAAEYLHIIYNYFGNSEKNDECLRFLAQQKKSEGQNKALVSQLEGVFHNHMNWKQERKATQEKREAVLKTIKTVISIGVIGGLFIIITMKRRNKKRIARQNKKHRTEQAALSSRLKQSNQKVRELKDQIRQQKNEVMSESEHAATFAEEPICCLIMERVNKGQFKSQIDCALYKDYALGKEQIVALREATDHHYGRFTTRLKMMYPQLTNTDLDYCCLYLLGLCDADISALMQKAYPTVSQRSRKIKAIFSSDAPLSTILRDYINSNL